MNREKWFNIFDHICEFCIYGLIFFTPISRAAIEIFSILAILCFLLKKIIKPDFKFLYDPLHLFLFLFIYLSALSMTNSGPYIVKSLKSLILKWIEYVLIFIVVGDTITTRKRLNNVLAVFLFTSFLVGIDVLSQRLLKIEFLRHRSMVEIIPSLKAATGPFNHFNDLGAYLVVVISLVTALLSSGKLKKPLDSILGLFGILLMMSIVLAFSRGSWLGLSGSLALMVFLSRKAKTILLLFIILALLITIIPQKKERILFFSRKGDSGRMNMWQGAIKMIKENPFLGKGIGTYMDHISSSFPNNIQYAHNCFLQIWAETGVFSLLSFLSFLGLLLSRGISYFRKQVDFVMLGLVCGIFGFLIHSAMDTHFYSLQLSALFWSMAGILNSLINISQS